MISYEPLRRQMKERGITLTRLAELTGVKRETLSIGLKKNLSVDSILKIASVLRCDISNIIEWKPGVKENRDTSKYFINWDVMKEKASYLSMSITKVSKRSGLSENALTKARRTNGKLRSENIKAIAMVLGCKTDELIIGDKI